MQYLKGNLNRIEEDGRYLAETDRARVRHEHFGCQIRISRRPRGWWRGLNNSMQRVLVVLILIGFELLWFR